MPPRRRGLIVALPLVAALTLILLSAVGPVFEAQTVRAQDEKPRKKKLSLRAMKKKMNGWHVSRQRAFSPAGDTRT